MALSSHTWRVDGWCGGGGGGSRRQIDNEKGTVCISLLSNDINWEGRNRTVLLMFFVSLIVISLMSYILYMWLLIRGIMRDNCPLQGCEPMR